jgi:deazaflavin-dependent oxidoreductase (nitroreductase family)
MPYPRWLAKINRRVFNPGQVRKGKYPVVTHVGRSSGTTYRTPMDAHPTRTGWVLVVRYGRQSDWVRNILAAGEATLRVKGEDHRLTSPRLVGRTEAHAALPDGYDRGKDFDKAEDFLLLDSAG